MHIAYSARFLNTHLDRRYRLERLVGEGASAWVFAAQDERLDRGVAVKLLKPPAVEERPDQRLRFLAEGRILAKLVHPHIVLVHDAGETAEGLGYLVMELSDAGNLDGELGRRGTLPLQEALCLLLPVMGALACAHEHGIVHRDLKPANVALLRKRGEVHAKLLDFGIAKSPYASFSTDSALGTPGYMAPEQARGDVLAPTADVWALGVVLFRCLSGRLPFAATSSIEALHKLVHERAPRFADMCPALGPHMAVVLDRALEPDPADRHQDMRSFARAIAIASAQDRVPLPRDPDPLGLPEFGRWMAIADLERTSSVGVPRQAISESAERVVLRAQRPLIVVALSWLVMVLGCVTLIRWAAPAAPEQRTRVAASASVIPAHTQAMEPASRVLTLAPGAACASAPETPGLAPSQTARRERRSPRATGTAPMSPQARVVVARDQAKSELIMDWEW